VSFKIACSLKVLFLSESFASLSTWYVCAQNISVYPALTMEAGCKIFGWSLSSNTYAKKLNEFRKRAIFFLISMAFCP
jgi:hypothetical protein